MYHSTPPSIFRSTNTIFIREITRVLRQFRLSDPRDRVYGVLDLVKWAPGSISVVDYNISTFDLALSVIKHVTSLGVTPLLLALEINASHPVLRSLVQRRLGKEDFEDRQHLRAKFRDVEHPGYASEKSLERHWATARFIIVVMAAWKHPYTTNIQPPTVQLLSRTFMSRDRACLHTGNKFLSGAGQRMFLQLVGLGSWQH